MSPAALGGVPIRTRIAASPNSQIKDGIVGAGHPDGPAAVLPASPCQVHGRFTRSGNGVETPHFTAGARVKRGDEARMPNSPPATPTMTLSLTTKRRQRHRVAGIRIGDLNIP